MATHASTRHLRPTPGVGPRMSSERTRRPQPEASRPIPYGPDRPTEGEGLEANSLGSNALRILGLAFRGLWSLITLPFRLIVGAIVLVSRVTGLVLGFSLMVGGVALCADPFLIFGIPIFLLGLWMTLRNLS